MARPDLDELAGTIMSEAARACTRRERAFAEAYVELGGDYGSGAEAARRAGYGTPTSIPQTFATTADRELRKPHVIAYIAELCRHTIRSLGPKAVKTVVKIMDSDGHKDQARMALSVLERIDPVETKHNIEVRHVVNHDQDAVDALRHMKSIGATPEMLEAHFGFTGLCRYERLLALEDATKKGVTIEGEFSEVADDRAKG